MKTYHLIPSLETTLYYHLSPSIHQLMITYEDTFAKSLHYVVDSIMEFNLQLIYIQFGEISSNEFPPSIAIDDIAIF